MVADGYKSYSRYEKYTIIYRHVICKWLPYGVAGSSVQHLFTIFYTVHTPYISIKQLYDVYGYHNPYFALFFHIIKTTNIFHSDLDFSLGSSLILFTCRRIYNLPEKCNKNQTVNCRVILFTIQLQTIMIQQNFTDVQREKRSSETTLDRKTVRQGRPDKILWSMIQGQGS